MTQEVKRHPVIAEAVSRNAQLAFWRSIGSVLLAKVLGRGHKECTWCGSPCLPPRSSWCSKHCYEEAQPYLVPQIMSHRVWVRDNGRCVFCGEHGHEVDHIIPVSRGGGLCTEENLRLLCKRCHLKETQKLLNEIATEKYCE